MKRLSRLPMVALTALTALAAGTPACLGEDTPTESSVESELVVAKPFRIRAVGNKCVDAGGPPWQTAGVPVYLYTCNGTDAQRFIVDEINQTHDITVRAMTGLCLGVRGGWVGAGRAIELQVCNGGAAQRFATDGDAIYMGLQASGQRVSRELVIEAQGQRGADRTPLVLGGQDTDPNEDLRFLALDAGAPRPTSGFVRVPSQTTLAAALALGTWGTVVEIDPGQVLWDRGGHELHEGVTLRGGQAARTIRGPEIKVPGDVVYQGLTFLRITGDRTRITGIRLRGPSTSSDNYYPVYNPLDPDHPRWVPYPSMLGVHAPTSLRAVIDHAELSAFPNAAIDVQGDNLLERFEDCPRPYPNPPENVRILHNYIYENRRESKGYGVVVSRGGFTYIGGNAFDDNRHAIAADGRTLTGYRALGNLVLRLAPWQHGGPLPLWQTHDFDMHGAEGDDGRGGVAGLFVEIGSNTFLGDREAYDLRGTPCFASSFHHNAVHEDFGAALELYTGTIGCGGAWLCEFSNLYQQPDPTNERALRGDFDGDGLLDDFVATGAAWYFVSNRVGPWRYLRMATDRVGQLGFADLDGDGRTDVWRWRADGARDVSWGGTSPWTYLGSSF